MSSRMVAALCLLSIALSIGFAGAQPPAFLENALTRRYVYDSATVVVDPNNRSSTGEGGWTTPQARPALSTDANYNNKCLFVLAPTQVDGRSGVYAIISLATNRCLLDTGNATNSSNRGSEGGWLSAPAVVMANNNYYNRCLWRPVLFSTEGGISQFLLENVETGRYLLDPGNPINVTRRGAENGFLYAPGIVSSDANYYNRAVWTTHTFSNPTTTPTPSMFPAPATAPSPVTGPNCSWFRYDRSSRLSVTGGSASNCEACRKGCELDFSCVFVSWNPNRVALFTNYSVCNDACVFFRSDGTRMPPTGAVPSCEACRLACLSDSQCVAFSFSGNSRIPPTNTQGCSNSITDGSLRLSGGNATRGRLEMYSVARNAWGTVCDDNMSVLAAQVACRQMGLPFARASWVTTPNATAFGPVNADNTDIFFDNYICLGNETRLTQCTTLQFPTTHNCNHNEDVIVTCIGAVSTPTPTPTPTPTLTPTGPPAPGNGDVRLAGGNSTHGRLEMWSSARNAWGTVCDDNMQMRAAVVACRQMGLPSGAANWATTTTNITYGNPPTGIFFDNFQCTGNEQRLTQCAATFPTLQDCTHWEDVVLTCPDPSSSRDGQLRLFNGTSNSGRLEVWSSVRNAWGTVCDDSMNAVAARIACRQLGLPSDGARFATTPNATAYGQPPAGIFLDGFACQGNESRLVDCAIQFPSLQDCGHNEDVVLTCLGGLY